jgi:putative tryptophan/tyrosine transport system substrate-binding protein
VPVPRDTPLIECVATSFALARDPGGGLIVMPDIFNATNRDLIIALAARYGVPVIYFTGAYFAKSGGLVCYGTDFAEQFR